MAKMETNLSNKDKVTIAIVLFVGVVFVFCWYAIRPTIMSIRSLSDDIDQASIKQVQYKGKVMTLSSAESIFNKVVGDLADSTSDYYGIMTSSEIDRLATNYVLSFGLFPEQLQISLPSGAVAETPYAYSQTAIAQSRAALPSTPVAASTNTDTSSSSASDADSLQVESLTVPYNQARDAATSTLFSGVQAADITLVVTGSEEACQALIDDLSSKTSARITAFEWLNIDPTLVYNEETGQYEYVEADYSRLRVNVRLYMADIADYAGIVSDAVEAAGSEG